MTTISYAQNFEDVMLLRAFRHIEKGFYVDVGANDPSVDSVTKAFYERGWHGINIEPLSSHFADLQRDRPHDINLRCAAGASEGEIDIWECDVRGWASADKETIEQHIATGKTGSYHRVPMATLTEICQRHAPHEIHFLKIDVEGYEHPVLAGMDFQRFRPWIVIVEATRPNSTEEIHSQWEDLLVGGGYIFGYADGLNRFYVAREHKELISALKYPPNVFDNFMHAGQMAEAEAMAQQVLQEKINEFESRSAAAESRSAAAESRAAELQTKLDAIMAANHLHWTLAEERAKEIQFLRQTIEMQTQENLEQIFRLTNAYEKNMQAIQESISWKITKPIRWCSNILLGTSITWNANQQKHSGIITKLLLHAKLYINRRPKLKQFSLALIDSFPSIGKRLRGAALIAPSTRPTDLTHTELPGRTQQIYSKLKEKLDKGDR